MIKNKPSIENSLPLPALSFNLGHQKYGSLVPTYILTESNDGNIFGHCSDVYGTRLIKCKFHSESLHVVGRGLNDMGNRFML